MKDRLEQIKEEVRKQVEAAGTLDKLNEVRVNALGKKGALTEVLKGMKNVAAEERPKIGQMVNDTRAEIEAMLEVTKKKMEGAIREAKMKEEVIDVTLPAKKNLVGHRHPNTIALEEVERIFIGMGYEVVEGPEVENDYYNFEALNIPKNHPTRDEQDTFYITDNILRISCCVPRPHRFRCVRWKKESCLSVCLRLDVYSVPMKWMPPIPLPSIR